MVAHRSLVRCAPIRTGRRRRTAVVFAAVALVGLVGWASPGTAGAVDSGKGGSGVLPASAKPFGYSLADMTSLLAVFTTSGNNPAYFPDTPFQILYTSPQTDPPLTEARFVMKDLVTPCDSPAPPCGLFFTQPQGVPYSNSFIVERGMKFFVPVDNANDLPPVVGNFPTNNDQARRYIFDPKQVGGRDFTITIDGVCTTLGPAYVAGPAPALAPPPEFGDFQMVTIGAFLAPMSPGHHKVRITGGYYGPAINEAYEPVGFPLGFIALDFTYSVTVTK
jgi:hypothetical protein